MLDASGVVAGLLNDGSARSLLATEQVHVPHLVDIEVASVLRRRALRGDLTQDQAWLALDTWRRLGVTRYDQVGLMDRVWELREDLSASDATSVALAESLGCALVTADRRLSLAPGLRCLVTVLPPA